MTREEAIAKIQGLLDDPIVRGGVAFVDQPTLRSIQDALRNPWVRTSDRLPTEADADEDGRIPVLAVGTHTGRLIKMTVHYEVVPANTEGIKYFLPIPPLPDV